MLALQFTALLLNSEPGLYQPRIRFKEPYSPLNSRGGLLEVVGSWRLSKGAWRIPHATVDTINQLPIGFGAKELRNPQNHRSVNADSFWLPYTLGLSVAQYTKVMQGCWHLQYFLHYSVLAGPFSHTQHIYLGNVALSVPVEPCPLRRGQHQEFPNMPLCQGMHLKP